LRNKNPRLFGQAYKYTGFDADFPPQIDFWTSIEVNHRELVSFPKFAPLGEWFMIGPASDGGHTFQTVDRQPWGTEPVLDLLAMTKRHGIMELTRTDEMALHLYMSNADNHAQLSPFKGSRKQSNRE
jgi:hypothetical protein